MKTCPTRQAGESLLKKVAEMAARFPEDTRVRLALSRAQIDWGDPQEALARLDAFLQDDGDNFEARYLAGLANLRLAGRSAGDALRGHVQAAQRHLQQARALNPRSPEAAFSAFKAEVAATDAPDDATLQGVISAWQASREVDALAGAAALAYAYTGKADEAFQALGSLTQNANGAPMAAWARQWQGRLQAGVTRGDILAEMRRNPASDAPFKEWTLDKSSVMQKVALNAGLESAQSFIKQQQDQQQPGMQPRNDMDGGTRRR